MTAGHTPAPQGCNDLFAQGLGELIELATDGRLVDAQHARDLCKGTAIEIIGAQDRAVFGGERCQGLVGGLRQALVGSRREWLGFGSAELDAFFGFLVEAYQALRPAVAVDVFLGQNGAQPAFEYPRPV